jgi:AraC-like DNA-binding protein
MEPLEPCYWRDAELAGIQFTANRFRQREVRPHRHSGHALAVADVDLEVRTSSGTVQVPAGALLRIGPRVWHAVTAQAPCWQEAALYCSTAVARCVNGFGEPRALVPHDGDDAVAVFPKQPWGYEFSECHRLLQRAHLDGDVEAGVLGRWLLRERLSQWIPVQAASLHTHEPHAPALPADERVQRLYRLIATRFQERITLQGLADTVGWHPVYMQRRFKHELRFTPHELLVGHRIEYARDLIAGGALVTQAAHAAGFADQSHLHKTFLSTYAVVPGEYRRLSPLDALQPPAARHGIAD